MILIPLQTDAATPLYEQIYQNIKKKITDGSLTCNTKLPSSRSLAEQLLVSRSTVNSAYEQLLSEGYIYAKEKSGYFVADISYSTKIESYSNSIEQNSPRVEFRKPSHSFSPFAIDTKLFPYTVWRKLMNEAVAGLNAQTLSLGEPMGDFEFRTAISEYLAQSRGVRCTPDQILIGAGTDYLLMLLCGLFAPELKIAMENPTYLRAYHVFCGLGRTVNPVSVTNLGIDIKELAASDSSIAYVTPSHQYPLGAVMPVTHRSELLDWAYRSEHRYIIEDDHDSEFRYKGLPIPSLQGMDTKGRVIYLGTFSRTIAPAIRVSYMVLPPELCKCYQQRFPHYSSTVSRVDQRILAEFIRGGYLERHLNKMRKTYHQRHDALLHALRCFGNSVDISGEYAGLHLVVSFLHYGTEENIQACASRVGMHLYSLREHAIAPIPISAPTFLLGFAGLSEQEIESSVAILYKELIASVHQR